MMAFRDDLRDTERMEAFFREYSHYFYCYAMRKVGNQAVAEDIVGDCIRKALEHYDVLRGMDASGQLRYMLRMLSNRCVDHYRAQEKEYANDEVVQFMNRTETVDSPQAKLEREVEQRLIRHCIEQLPENYRTVLVLREVQKMEYAQIAAVMNVSEPNARMLLTRAKRSLSKLYRAEEERWKDHEPGTEL